MREDFLIPFTSFAPSQEDVALIQSMLHEHDATKQLEYHGYLNLRSILKTSFGKNLTELATKLGLRVARINAFTARPGTVTSNHIDGNATEGPLLWRLAFYVGGEPGVISWHARPDNFANFFDNHSGAFVLPITEPALHQETLSMSGAFIRTEYPHVLDVSKNMQPRLTISATFVPGVSWSELTRRISECM